ncbi:hypothetical protein L3X38_011459 [Prunus dulcis]|uniref:Transposable element protein n=1 Tax=Prunus dulcis TaxID=3755 RepID=A0AAD4ZFQ5_PRUDU|nr:hypothetical protein L3X38_011459 [Prunus dulcis]
MGKPEYGGEVMQIDRYKNPKDKAPIPCAFQEPMMVPRHMQDGSMVVAEQLETINLSDDPSVQRPISINVHLTRKEKEALPQRNFHPEIEKQIKVEVEKLLVTGFIKPSIQHG